MFQTCTTEHLPSFLPFLGFPFNHLALPLFCTASGFVLLLRSLRLQGPFDVNFIVPYVHMSHDSPTYCDTCGTCRYGSNLSLIGIALRQPSVITVVEMAGKGFWHVGVPDLNSLWDILGTGEAVTPAWSLDGALSVDW